jgi:Met-zincin/Domain of unknown function (DUF5117)/Domain of unknown function (DUF5118)
MNKKSLKAILLGILVFSISVSQAQEAEAFLKDCKKIEGFFDFYWNETKGKVYLEIKNTGEEFLYYNSLSQGLGSNDIGLDRGRLGTEHVVRFERFGNKMMLIEPNYAYRALSNDALEQKAVTESFAKSTHFGFEILRADSKAILVDFTPFLLRDALDASGAISAAKQGAYSFDASRSGIYLPMCKSFPKNTEFEAMISLIGTKAGNYLAEVVPTPQFVSMHQHHSFVKLPEAGFKPREFDPRIGYNGIEFYDYSTPISQPIVKKYISRHRLIKKDPTAVFSEPVEPIVYYLDAGVPEPIRSALFEGATWWNQAFEAAGYKNAFQVKMLPPDADPMDVRYNLVQWVHRSTRGWSYGASIIDPRTGEILKGKVTLGSLRVRQDYLLAQGLAGDFSANGNDDALNALALDRLKQLSAHEIGHTLGLPHNYISSIQGRASVMDYPHPLVFLKDGKVDLSEAYTHEIGEYDKASIVWGYQDFPPNVDEKAELERIVQQTKRKQLQFLTDQDARPDGSVHPQTHLWDNGTNSADELSRIVELRRVVLDGFDLKKLPAKAPIATLEEVFVPMFMLHRFQVQAAAKMLGGAFYENALNGDSFRGFKPVAAADQRQSLRTMLATLQPSFLAVPKPVLDLISPRPFRYPANARETFKRRSGLAFDVLSPAEVSAQLTLSLILNPQRVTRLATHQVYDKTMPSLTEVLEVMTHDIVKNEILERNTYFGQIKRVVAEMYIQELRKIAYNPAVGLEARLNATQEVENIRVYFSSHQTKLGSFGRYILERLKGNFNEQEASKQADYFIAPDGQPIDQSQDWLEMPCDH